MEARRKTQVEQMIFYAVRAGAFRAAARVYLDAAATFEAAAAINSAKARGLADRIAMAGCVNTPATRLPGRQER